MEEQIEFEVIDNSLYCYTLSNVGLTGNWPHEPTTIDCHPAHIVIHKFVPFAIECYFPQLMTRY